MSLGNRDRSLILVVGELRRSLLEVLVSQTTWVHVVQRAEHAVSVLEAGVRPSLVVLSSAGSTWSVLRVLDTPELSGTLVAILTDDDEPSEDPVSGVFVLGANDTAGLRRVIDSHVERRARR
jgi:hypothetical protein